MSGSETLRLTKTDDLSDPFITAGDRAYLIGAQHGGFPDIGWHTAGEMGGIWAHPVKLLDGFWLSIDGHWLRDASRFIGEPFSNEQEYDLEDSPSPPNPKAGRPRGYPGTGLQGRLGEGEKAAVGLSPRPQCGRGVGGEGEGRLQGHPEGTRGTHEGMSLQVTRRHFVPDGEPAVVVRYSFRSSVRRRLALRFLARTDLQAVWPGDANGSDQATYDADLGAWVCRDERNPWYVVVGEDAQGHRVPPGCGTRQPGPKGARGVTQALTRGVTQALTRGVPGPSGREVWGPEQTKGNGISVTLDCSLEVEPGQDAHLAFIICGSDRDREHAGETFRRVRGCVDSMWQSKAARYGALLRRSALTVPDASIERAWDWIKCDYDWLVRDVPKTGRGLGAGAEEYVWWFGCDASYALLGALALGQHEMAVETIDLLRSASWHANGGTGRVIHERTTAGYVPHLGCVQETPQFITTVWQAFRWTGDLSFLERNYEFCKRGLLGWTLGEQCPDGDRLPVGCGITEWEGMDLQCIDTAAYTVKALMALADMAKVLDDEPVASRCATLTAPARSRLEDAFWMEDEGLYGDMVATPAEMIPRLHQWLSQTEGVYYRSGQASDVGSGLGQLLHDAESDQQPNRKRPWLLKHWIVVCPLEQQLTAPDRAARSLDRLEGPEFTGRWGMYLSGFDRTRVMSISTGALAVAEMAYGRVERGLQYVRALTDALDMHMPGAISEMLPNYGCFLQAWSGYAVVWPLVTYMFGIQPDAYDKHLTLSPRFPDGWPAAHLTNVRIGGTTFDFDWDGSYLTVTVHEPGWTIGHPPGDAGHHTQADPEGAPGVPGDAPTATVPIRMRP